MIRRILNLGWALAIVMLAIGGGMIGSQYIEPSLAQVFGVFQFGGYKTASLPTCNATNAGQMTTTIDAASTPVLGATATGSGSIRLGVICDGAHWINN